LDTPSYVQFNIPQVRCGADHNHIR